jgi:hypothetical protein
MKTGKMTHWGIVIEYVIEELIYLKGLMEFGYFKVGIQKKLSIFLVSYTFRVTIPIKWKNGEVWINK